MSNEKKILLIKPTTIKAYLRDAGDLRVSGDCMDAINAAVAVMLRRAHQRCVDNGRKTVKACDI
jgi:histone H3/H4